MMKRIAVAVASCLALAACGGDSGGNAAAGKTFNYGATAPTNGSQSSALDVQLSGALALKSAPDATSAQDLASVSDITTALLGSSGLVATASPAQQRLLAIGARAASRQLTSGGAVFENPACVVTTTTSVKMTGCTITVTDPSMTSKVQVDGSLSFDPAKGTLTWELTVSDATSFTAQGMSGTASVRAHESGTLTVTDTTIKGQLLAEASASASASSAAGSASMGVSEAVTLDVTYQGSPACVTGGTLEAKRVWTERPSGATGPEFADAAAKVTWTACGVGTIAFAH
jgi:hypothetical protein